MGNSRFRFRAWHKDAKEFCAGSTSNMFKWAEEGQPVVLQQFTGLTDKNGVEIYESDIVSMHQFLFEGQEVERMISGVIGWDEYGLTIKQVRNEFVEEYCGYDAGEGEIPLNAFYGLHEESWEILGNIHQHPELLEAVK